MLGTLRHRVTIRTATPSDDGQGGQTVSWADTATVWAAVDPAGGRETLQVQGVHNGAAHRIRLRYSASLTVKSRLYVESAGPLLEVNELRNPDKRNRWLDVLATEIDG